MKPVTGNYIAVQKKNKVIHHFLFANNSKYVVFRIKHNMLRNTCINKVVFLVFILRG